jgi:periplasmic copper chaperone A
MTPRRITAVLATAGACLLVPSWAQAHVSLHPNAIPAGSEVTVNIRVPNEITRGDIRSVAIKLPGGVLEALGDPPPGWTFRATTEKLPKPVTTDDGTVTTEVTKVVFSGGHTPPGQFVNLPLTFSMPSSARAGQVIRFPTVQTYSDGEVVRWIDPSAQDEHPAPTIDVTRAGEALLDVTGGDAGPPAKLPRDLAGATSAGGSSASGGAAAPTVTRTIVKHDTSTLSIVALILGAVALLVGLASLTRRRATV